MPFEIVRNDITNMCVDAIVNSANPRPMVGLGTDSSIHEKAGPELLAARQKIGPVAMGQAAITPAFRLHAKYVIHTVGPVWDGGSYGEETLLRSCYDQSLKLASEHDCKSIAFPLIATNNYGFPKDKALRIAVAAFSEFLLEHEMLIYLVVFDRGAYKLSEKLFHSIASYIDDHYVDLWEEATYGGEKEYRQQSIRRRRDRELFRKSSVCEDAAPCAPMSMPMAAIPKPASLKELLSQADAGFTETLLKLIDKTGKKDSEIYKKANLSKQHFSKIRNNPDYKPNKQTAIALALALELDLEQTKDLIGSPYEFDRGSKAKDFPLFSKHSTFTDDTVMTLAVADALLDAQPDADLEWTRNRLIHGMQRFGKEFPYAGYGGMFRHWLRARDPQPYGSYGNGSAMRVSSVGWLYNDLDTVRRMACLSAEVTHNHPEGIKGAEAVASAIFLARTGSTKNEIKAYVVENFHYDLSRTCDEIRPDYHHVESCQETVPEAITAFLEGESFEDVIRTAVSLGGDCDTLTCIAGSMAEAFYGVPEELKSECRKRLPDDLLEVLQRLDDYLCE